MLFTIIIGLLVIILSIRWLTRKKIDLSHIPGPSTSPLWQLLNPSDAAKMHLLFQDMTKKYGPVMKIPQIGSDILVVSNYDSIRQVCLTEGKTFGGRPNQFRIDAIVGDTAILNNVEPDKKWKKLRKISQQHLRQFGDGLSRLEAIIADIAEDMFAEFKENTGKPYDPNNDVFKTALNSIAFLIIGCRLKDGDPTLELMREYEALGRLVGSIDSSIKYRILDVFPWLRHLKWPGWNAIKRMLEVEQIIWKHSSQYSETNPDAENLYKVFAERLAKGDEDISELDASKSTVILLAAGVITTSSTFSGLIKMLAHNKDIQERLWEEQQKVQEETGSEVSLKDRPQMPYTRAVILEILRYQSTVPLGVPHQSVINGEINGYKIPAGTLIITLLWELHHDEKFWKNPYDFKPERFLDETGDVVPADHPNRKHLMPFGAGTRVCLGESLAFARLFLWLTTMIRKFVISPSVNDMKESVDARKFPFVGVIKPHPYEIICSNRL